MTDSPQSALINSKPLFSDPLEGTGSSLSRLLAVAAGPGDMPVTPTIAEAAPLENTSPHRFLTSAALYEEQPRSRHNKFVVDEAGCVEPEASPHEIAAEGTGDSLPMQSPMRTLASNAAATGSSLPHQTTGDSLAIMLNGPWGPANAGSFYLTSEDYGDEVARSANRDAIVRRLRGTQHFGMLPRAQLEYIADNMEVMQPAKGTIVQEYESVCTGVYVVLRGRVAVFKRSPRTDGTFDSQWWLGRGDSFCFDYLVLKSHCHRRYQVMNEDTVLGYFNYRVFFNVVKENPSTAQSLARKMGEDMQAYKVFKDYARAVFAPTVNGDPVVNWSKVLEKFGRINNGIYPEMHAPELDVGAWTYALRRLPDNITRTLVVELAKAPPPMMASRMRELAAKYDQNPSAAPPKTNDGKISYVGCAVRRRPSYQLGNGKTLVILRDSTTDLLDFTSCMCVHMNESDKLRKRLLNQTDPNLIPNLEACMENCSMDGIKATLDKMPFSDLEKGGLIKLWGADTIRNVFDILTTRREDLLVRVDLQSFRRFYRTPSTIFASNIRHAILRRLGLEIDGDLPSNLIIDIISSNAHSVKNLLSGFVRQNQKAILDYARENCTEIYCLEWRNREDLIYYVFSKYLKEHDAARKEFANSWREAGITVIEQTSMTGLEADIVDVSCIKPENVDTHLTEAARAVRKRMSSPFAAPHFIINFDFPFGMQAESIMKSLNVAFGRSIRSMNIMGKGGGVVGRRGDIQFATHVLYSKSSVPYDDFVDELRPCGQEDISPEKLQALVGDERSVHVGPVLTIAGTMNQNSKLLRFYKHLWGCVGMEMEGSFFDRALREGVEQGVLRRDIKTRFLYYTSDTPLQQEHSLASGMTPTEGVPSSYAISRTYMETILNDESPTIVE